MAPQHSFYGIWDSNEDIDAALVPLQPNGLDDLDDDFFMIVDDVEEDEALGLLDKDGMDIDTPRLTTLEASLCDRPTTPPPPRKAPMLMVVSDDSSDYRNDGRMDESYDIPRMVTPEVPRKRVLALDDIEVPDQFELRIQYLKSCKNLAESMWKAEESRRTRAHQCELFGEEKPDKIFDKAKKLLSGVSSTLTPELEESRKTMWSIIQSRHHEDIFEDPCFFEDQDFFDDNGSLDDDDDSFDDDDTFEDDDGAKNNSDPAVEVGKAKPDPTGLLPDPEGVKA